MASRTDQARELALRLIGERPGVQQRELVTAIQDDTDLATSTITRLLQAMEDEGAIDGRRDGERKAYALPRPPPPWAPKPDAPAPAARSVSRGRRGELVAVVTALFVAASLVAFVLAPNKDDDTGGGGSATPAAAPAPAPAPAPARSKAPAAAPKPAPKPKPKPRSTGALAAAKRTRVAVLSGSAVPGIAGKTADALKREGFRVGTVTNAPGPSARSLVLYARGKKAAATALARSLKVGVVQAAGPSFQAIAPKAALIVVVGADRRR